MCMASKQSLYLEQASYYTTVAKNTKKRQMKEYNRIPIGLCLLLGWYQVPNGNRTLGEQ